MPVISRFYGIIVMIHFREHSPPHFHAKYGGSKALVEIDSGAMEGKLPPRAERLIQEWRAAHIKELHTAWDLAQKNLVPTPIAPLE